MDWRGSAWCVWVRRDRVRRVQDSDGAEISHDRREEVERVLALSAFVVVEQNSK